MKYLFVLLVSILFQCTPAFADDKVELKMPLHQPIGAEIEIGIQAPQNSTVFFMTSFFLEEWKNEYGIFHLGFPLASWCVFQMPKNDNELTLRCYIDCSPEFIGHHIYGEFLSITKKGYEISNLECTYFEDNPDCWCE